MVKLVQKSGYIRAGKAAGYMRYIATRRDVEKLHGQGPATQKQQRLITGLLQDFPDSRELFEYADYQAAPTVGNASAFIAMALDANVHAMAESDGYMKYIATRPRVEKWGDHGLFGKNEAVDLAAAMAELEAHSGNVWTIIYSLRREDAARLGYDRAETWQGLLKAKQLELAAAMKISSDQFIWYTAYHDEGHHPHIHLMVWSQDPRQGYLTREGIEAMRSVMTNAIFQDELLPIYEQKDISYKALTTAAREAMRELVGFMETGFCDSPRIETLLGDLAEQLKTVSGKKQYGYLPKSVKKLVDETVDELACLPNVAACYEEWNRLRDGVEGYYKDIPREHLPLSQQKEFRAVKNIVVREAENIRLGLHTFEDEGMRDEGEEDAGYRSVYRQANEYRAAKRLLYDNDAPPEQKQAALLSLSHLWDQGYSVAAHLLGKIYRDGIAVLPAPAAAERWFSLSAQAGNDFSAYALGKLLLSQRRGQQAIEWFKQAAEQRNRFAGYQLGMIYLSGEYAAKDLAQALHYLTADANQGNQFAQYTLGKLYLLDNELPHDPQQAVYWLTLAAVQGNQYAQFFLERLDQLHDPNLFLAATRLLRQVGRVFRDNALPPANPAGIRIDSKRRRMLMDKRLALGQRPDDTMQHMG